MELQKEGITKDDMKLAAHSVLSHQTNIFNDMLNTK